MNIKSIERNKYADMLHTTIYPAGVDYVAIVANALTSRLVSLNKELVNIKIGFTK